MAALGGSFSVASAGRISIAWRITQIATICAVLVRKRNKKRRKPTMVTREELVAYLNDYLAIRDVPDWKDAYNGLQVEGRAEVRKIAVAVDACLATIERAVAEGADMMLVHHGLFWGAKAPVTGAYYRRLALL